MNDLSQKNEEKARTVAAQDKELNTAYYVFGTKKELREQRILKSGDVLKSNDFNKDYFTRIDLRVTKQNVYTQRKSAKLMTDHPARRTARKGCSEPVCAPYQQSPGILEREQVLVIIVK